jgi:hypothetical protein
MTSPRSSISLAILAAVLFGTSAQNASSQPINPQVYKAEFDKVRKDAEAVARVRVLAAVCTEKSDEGGKKGSVVLQVTLQVLEAEKGPLQKNQVIVISHKVNLPSGPGPGSYGYMGAIRRVPFTPGVKGDVALKWDNERRSYGVVAGWVAEPNGSPAAIPTEVGKAFVAGDSAAVKKDPPAPPQP